MEARRINSQIVQNISTEDEPSGYAFTRLNIAEIDVIIGATRREVQQNLEKAKVCFDRIGHLAAGKQLWQTLISERVTPNLRALYSKNV
jgi:enoyl reductase-like protein